VGASIEAGGGAFGFSAKASASFSFNRDTSESSDIHTLTKQKGEITISEAQCFTHDVTVAKYARARFTCDFVNAIETMSNLGKDCRHDEAKSFYKEFVEVNTCWTLSLL